MAENTLVAEPRSWYTTKQLCGTAGGNLSIAKSRNLAEFSVSIRDSVGAWLGGRRVAQSWEWAGEGLPLYWYHGCYDGQAVQLHQTDKPPVLGNQCVIDCFVACATVAVALKLEQCVCLRSAPRIMYEAREIKCSKTCAANFLETCGDDKTYSVYTKDELEYTIESNPWKSSSKITDNSQCGFLHQRNKKVYISFDKCGDNSQTRKYAFCEACEIAFFEPCSLRWTDFPVFFNDAAEWCKENNMSLATSASGKDFVNHTKPGKPTWVGLKTTAVMLWYNGSTIDPADFDSGVSYLDGDCVAVVLDQSGNLRLQLEDCIKHKPYLCDADPPVANLNRSRIVQSTTPNSTPAERFVPTTAYYVNADNMSDPLDSTLRSSYTSKASGSYYKNKFTTNRKSGMSITGIYIIMPLVMGLLIFFIIIVCLTARKKSPQKESPGEMENIR